MHSTLEAGGLIDEVSACFAIYGRDLDPDDVTQLLGCAPTRAHRRGDARSPRPHIAPHEQGAWLLSVRGTAPRTPEELGNAVLDQLRANDALIRSLADRYDVQLRFGLHMTRWNRGFAFSRVFIERVSRIGAKLDFDVYAYLEDETPLH